MRRSTVHRGWFDVGGWRLNVFTPVAAWLMAFLMGASVHAAFVYETPAEFLTSGDFNGDGIADVLVLDKATGNARVGYQNPGGALTWSQPLPTGVESASALAVGRFSQTSNDVIAVTSAGLNRIHVLSLSNSVTAPAPTIINPPHPATTMLVALDAPYGVTASRSWLTAGTHDPGLTLLDLLAFALDGSSAFQDQIATEGFLSSGSSFQRSASDATLLAAITRGTNDTFVAFAYSNTAAPVLIRSNLPSGSEYVFGHFNNEPYPRLLFYVPGQSNVIVQPLTNTGSGFEFGAATVNTFTSAVQQVYFVDEQTNGLAVIRFGDGIVGLRPPSGGGGQLQVTPGIGLGPSGNIVGVAPLGIGKFAVLSRSSNSVYSATAQVFTLSGTNYTLTSSSALPSVTTKGTRGNVWLFQTEPFLSSAATLIGSLNAPAWSSTIIGLPGALSVRVESDGGLTSGLGSPGTNNFGPPPAGTSYVLPNQYRDDVSFFGYAPPRAPEASVITIAPPPGSYDGPIQISFNRQNAADDVYYRTTLGESWQFYAAPFVLTNDATVEYYGSTLSGARSRTQYASYDLGNTNLSAEPLIDLPGGDTNPPPILNTNFLQISANGTVFYSRHSPLAELSGFLGPSPYLSFAASPFSASGFNYFYLEDFEDGALNTPGATPSAGWVVAGPGVDSVDPGGRSYYSSGQTSLTINFNSQQLGGKLPTHAGIVWTDVGQTTGLYGFGNVVFSAKDANGISLGSVTGPNLGDGQANPNQAEDRFFGVVNAGGISSITISMPASGDWEVDHLQYGYLDTNGFNGSIWAINLDGSGETFITSGHRPRVTRDGKLMAFLREGQPAASQGNLWLRDLQTGLETCFFTNQNSAIVGFDWRGAQNDLVFDYGCSIWDRSLAGSLSSVPFPTDCFADAPVVNPADGSLAFHVLGPNGPPGIYVTPPNWNAPTQLNLPIAGWRWPAWSPNGTQLLIADGEFSTVENRGTNLWIVGADGSDLRQITALTGTNGFPRGAIWKPDASCLVGAGRIYGTNGLWVIPLAANGTSCHCPPRLLPTSPGDPIDFAGSIVIAEPAQAVANSGLFIRLDPTVMVVYWSTDFAGFTLEYTSDLSNPIWKPIAGPYFLNGNYYEYREARTTLQPTRYFRLRYPGVIILTPPQPQLSLSLAPNQRVLNWPLAYVGFMLEVTTNLSAPTVWTPLPGPYSITNDMFEFRRNLPSAPPAEFYRLRW